MKRHTKYIRKLMMAKSLLPLIMMLALSVNASAYDFKVDGLCYDMHYDNTVMVTYELERSSDNYRSLKGDVVIPAQVTYKGKYYAVMQIGESAFEGCTGLTSVTIPNSVTKIGEKSFWNCASLTSVIIPNSVIEIGNSSFEGCTGLKSVTIPNSVSRVGWGAFIGCANLESINVDSTNTTFDSRENCNAIIETATNTLVVGCKNTKIPATIKSICWDSFAGCTGLTSLTIPNSVTWIGDDAFEGCTGLISVNIPNSVTEIGGSAFKGCTSMTSVNIPNSVTEIGSSAFEGCTSLTSVNIPNSVTWIDFFAFKGCTGLTSMTIPNSVTWIGDGAFEGCTGLTSVSIPNSVTKIAWNAFEGCTNLASIDIEPTNTTFDSRDNCNAIIETATNTLVVGCKNTKIPATITEIGSFAFCGCTGLKSVTIPNSVSRVGWGAFIGCANLESINVDSTNTTFDSRENCNAIIETATNTLVVGCKNTKIPATIKSICWDSFAGCTGLTSLTIPNSVTVIGDDAFEGCTGLISVNIPNSVTEIGGSAFKGCTSMTSVTIPNSVTEIGGSAFKGCTSMTSVNIPNSVTWIGGSAFKGCTSMTSVNIPNSVTEIGSSAFEGCTGLTSVTIPNSVKQIGLNAFKGCTNLVSIDVEPTNTTFDSRANCNAIIETKANLLIVGCDDTKIPTTVKEIGSAAFYGRTGLTSLTIPNSVTEIGSSAFEGCTGLTSLTISNSVTVIGDDAFEGCTGLTSVTIPNSVTRIGERAFKGCTGLTSVTIPSSGAKEFNFIFDDFTGLKLVNIPNSVTKIGNYAFAGCTTMTSVTIPNSVTEIGERAFRGCTGLTSVTIPSSVKKIGSGAFENCINLESIVCWNKDPKTISTDLEAFKNVNRQTCNLIVPSCTIASYISVAPWCYFDNKIDTLDITIDTEVVELDPLLLKQKFQQYYNKKQYSKAIQIGELLIAQTGVSTDRSFIEQLAFCYYKEENYIKAKEYYEIIDTNFADLNENDSYEAAHRNEIMGDCCMETNDYVNAEKYYNNAHDNYLSCDSPSLQIKVAEMLFMIHSCCIAQGKLREAIDSYLDSQPILNSQSNLDSYFEKVANFSDSRLWNILSGYYESQNLSRISERGDDLCNQNQYDEALEMYADGIDLYQKIKGQQSPELAVMYERKGRCYLMMQQYAQAQNYLNLSKDIMDIMEMKYEYSKDDYDTFIKNTIITLIRSKYYGDLILDYGIYYASQDDFDSSYSNLKSILDHIYKKSIDFLGNNTSAERSAYWEKNSRLFCEIYPYVVTMATNERFSRHNNMNLNYSDMYGDLYNKSALFAKGLLLTYDNEFSRIIYESGDSILISRYKELEELRNFRGPLTEEQRTEIEKKSKELESELIAISNYEEFIKNIKLTWDSVQARLRPDDIAIEFLSFPKLGSDSILYIALTVRKDYDKPHLVFLCEEHELQAAAKKANTSNELSKLIWGKLSEELKGNKDSAKVKNIYFSPSGALHQVAIESMPHWKKRKTLMNQCYNIYRLSSTRELVIERESIQSHTAAIYGDINYNTEVDSMGTRHLDNYPRDLAPNYITRGFDADAAGYRGKIWDDLKYAREEVDSIVRILKNERILVDSLTVNDATETSFKDLRGQKKNIIHIATHGFCWNDSVAKEQEKNSKRPLSFLGNGLDAMTRSGLLFSGANNCFADSVVIPDSIDDGVLTAYEASMLDLRGLDLLVLSACETGLGEISAEGVFGLQRGFKKAGARSIIMSLWKVNDMATRDMMTQFYKYWIEYGMSKHKAFLKAQQYVKDHDDEYKYNDDKKIDKKLRATQPHWAAFILLDALETDTQSTSP